MIVHLYTICWNEADLLGFFFRHYDSWIDRYIIYDDGSTDGLREILTARPKVELLSFPRSDPKSFVGSHTKLQNEAWKSSRGLADWVVITAIDEHLWVRGTEMTRYLRRQQDDGVTVIPALGFDMNSDTLPADHGRLIELVTCGRPRRFFNKLGIFDPAAVKETKFVPGRHSAAPEGRVVLPLRDELMLWHYKHLGFERTSARHAALAARLGTADRTNGWGHRYDWSKNELRQTWEEMRATSFELGSATGDPALACEPPLWWRPDQRLGTKPYCSLRRADGSTPFQALDRATMARHSVPIQQENSGLAPASLALANPSMSWVADVVAPVSRLPGTRPDIIPRRQKPKVSVVIKSYNHSAYVGRTLQSVLDQSFQDFEIVITDDGSTDDTVSVLRGFVDPRIDLETFDTNRGISAAMNATISRAIGEYIAILNSDDWALPERLARQVALLDENPDVAAVFGRPLIVDEQDQPVEGDNPFSPAFELPDLCRATLLRHFFFHGNCLCAPTAMIRRSVFQHIGGYDLRLTNLQDFDMWVRMLISKLDICLLSGSPLTAFRIRENNRNMSAPRQDTLLRCEFEFAHILQHFASLDLARFAEIFSPEVTSIPRIANSDLPIALAELALTVPRRSHRWFALETLYRAAASSADYSRLRDLTGSIDVFGVWTSQTEQAKTEAVIAQLRAFEASTSWRVTRPLRAIFACVPPRWRGRGRPKA